VGSSNAQDNANNGCTGPQILDAYKLDGRLLWRIDLGPNIRSGATTRSSWSMTWTATQGRGDGETADGTIDGNGDTIENAAARYADQNGRVLRARNTSASSTGKPAE